MTPHVSVIITTRGRPHLVPRAVHSALSQTLDSIEVIVVVDGPDPETAAALGSVADPRLRIHVREQCGGQPAAINDGVALARAPWAAMLDDDDEWMPEKLAAQLACAETSGLPEPVVGCRFLARSEAGDARWPLRAPRPGERIGDYLFHRTRLAFGEGMLPTSVLFAHTALFRACPMNPDLHKHCDLDWLVRADAVHGARALLPEGAQPLAIWNMQSGRARLSNAHDWRFSFDWMRQRRPLVTDRAYSGFLLTWASLSARAQRDCRAILFLLAEAFRSGRPSLRELVVFGAVWTLPMGLRARLSRTVASRAFREGGDE